MKYYRQEVEELLKENNIEYRIMDTPIMSIIEAKHFPLPHREAATKTLLLTDNKKEKLYCVCVFEDKSVDLKQLRELISSRRLSFASNEQLQQSMAISGGVSPLGVLNDENRKVEVIIDKYFEDKLIMIHPNDEATTIWLKTTDLVSIIEKHGNKCLLIEL